MPTVEPATHPISRAARLITAAAAIAVTAFIGGGAATATAPVREAIIDGSQNGFLRTDYIEVGARPNGSFGSNTAVPDGTWHTNDTQHPDHLGFRVDRGKDGWGTGIDDGDFFMPGTPYEGFGLEVDGNKLKQNNHYWTEIAGSFTSSSTVGRPALEWTSSADTNGIALKQRYSLPTDGSLFIDITVTLTNHNGTSSEVYYGRSVDPDNCKTRTTAVCDTNGDHAADNTGTYKTWNKIESQRLDSGASSTVASRQTDGSTVALSTSDSQSVVLAGQQEWGCWLPEKMKSSYEAARTATTSSGWADDTSCPWYNKVGEEALLDDNLNLVIRRIIPAGESVTFNLRYLLTETSLTHAGDPGTAPVVVSPGGSTSVTADQPIPAITFASAPASIASDWTTPPTCAVYASGDTGFLTPLTGTQPVGTYVTHCTGGESPYLDPIQWIDGSFTVNAVTLPPTGANPAGAVLAALGLLALGVGFGLVSRHRSRTV